MKTTTVGLALALATATIPANASDDVLALTGIAYMKAHAVDGVVSTDFAECRFSDSTVEIVSADGVYATSLNGSHNVKETYGVSDTCSWTEDGTTLLFNRVAEVKAGNLTAKNNQIGDLIEKMKNGCVTKAHSEGLQAYGLKASCAMTETGYTPVIFKM